MKTVTVCVKNQAEADLLIPEVLEVTADLRVCVVGPMEGPVDLTDIDYCAFMRQHGIPDAGVHPYDPQIRYDVLRGHMKGPDDVGLPHLDWVLCFGGGKPVHPDWVRSLRDQCVAAGVPFAFLGWGDWVPNGQGVDVSHYSVEEIWLSRDGDYRYWLNSQCEDTPLRVVMNRVGCDRSGHSLDGEVWDQRPESRA